MKELENKQNRRNNNIATGVTSGTIARTICLVLALINQVLIIFGVSPIPIENEEIELLIATIITIVTAVISWWKNNSITKNAQRADVYLSGLRETEDNKNEL